MSTTVSLNSSGTISCTTFYGGSEKGRSYEFASGNDRITLTEEDFLTLIRLGGVDVSDSPSVIEELEKLHHDAARKVVDADQRAARLRRSNPDAADVATATAELLTRYSWGVRDALNLVRRLANQNQ